MNVCNGIHSEHSTTPFNIKSMTSSLRLQFERMGFGIQNPFIQTDQAGLREQQIVILERFGQPKTLHRIKRFVLLGEDVGNCGIGSDLADGVLVAFMVASNIAQPFSIQLASPVIRYIYHTDSMASGLSKASAHWPFTHTERVVESGIPKDILF